MKPISRVFILIHWWSFDTNKLLNFGVLAISSFPPEIRAKHIFKSFISWNYVGHMLWLQNVYRINKTTKSNINKIKLVSNAKLD